jgi:hypothetical protein
MGDTAASEIMKMASDTILNELIAVLRQCCRQTLSPPV